MGHDVAHEVARLTQVRVNEGERTILHVEDWAVARGAHTVVLGPNGAGKSTVLRLLSGYRYPSTGHGTVDILGERLGRVDLRTLRRRIGIVNASTDELLARDIPVRALVAGVLVGLTDPRPDQLDGGHLERAGAALELVGAAHLGDRFGGTLSAGEWQRVRLARALVAEPELLLLDEPCTGLDLAQRAHFLAHLDHVLTRPDAPTAIVVTHHLEQVPSAATHAMLLRDGEVVASGPIDATLTSAAVSETYGLAVEVVRHRAGWTATAEV